MKKIHRTFWEWISWQEEVGPCELDHCHELVAFALYLTD
jgi:hypothetical protein